MAVAVKNSPGALSSSPFERPAVVTTALPVFGGESGRRGIEATFQKTGALHDGDNLILSGALTGQKVGSAHSGSSIDDEGTQVLGRVDRIGMCERGFQVDGSEALTVEDLILVGLIYHIIRQRQARQHAAHHGGS